MSYLSNLNNVLEQYSNNKNLSNRITFHSKYSTSKISAHDWFFEQYQLKPGCRILELGCGTGAQWDGRIEALPEHTTLVLSDLSDGMLDTVHQKFSQYPQVLIQKINIMDIPFHAETFDYVIANYMLYHIPDLPKAISEVKRVSKSSGIFYAATNGAGGMRAYLHDKLQLFNPGLRAFETIPSFTIQNGENILCEFYSCVKLVEFNDSLSVTKTQDLIDWIYSVVSISSFEETDLNGLYDFFEEIRQKEGTINIPKEMGLFISSI